MEKPTKPTLAETIPELAAQADGWDPSTVAPFSGKKLSWICSENHRWVARVADRSQGTGCPYCAGQKVLIGFNDLLTVEPQIALEADGWDPRTVTRSTSRKLSWRCPQGHQYDAAVSMRSSGTGCPICNGKKVLTGFNDLQTTDPEIALQAFEWDPKSVTRSSGHKMKWKCSQGHITTTVIASKTSGKSGCAICSGHETLLGFNDLKTTHPDLAAQAVGWDPTTVTRGSHSMRIWKCELQHEWKATVKDRVAGYGCPYCTNKKVLVGFNDLATIKPDLAAQAVGWDPTTVTTNSGFRKKWQCDQGHVWSALISSRAISGCPSCAQTGFDPNQPGFLYLIDHIDLNMFQIGISNFPKKRLSSHKRRGWDVIELRGPMDGHLTQQLETNCLHALEKRGAILGHKAGIDKFDGYSEAWTKESLNVSSIKQILDWVYEDEGTSNSRNEEGSQG